MTLNESKLGKFGRSAKRVFAALLVMVFVGGSLFYVTAQRSASAPAGHNLSTGVLDTQSSLNALPNPNAGTPVATTPYFQQIYCASDNGRRNYCDTDTRGGVRLVRQRSGSACVEGRSWGYDRRGIWVDRGCRADFEVGDRYRDRDYGRGRGRDRENDRDRDRGRTTQTFYCESGDMKRHWCSEGINGSVRLVRQRSDAACVFGRTWGQDRNGVWVDRGCRADFEVTR
jgi:hypothetical protein